MNCSEFYGLTEIQTFLDRMDIALFAYNFRLKTSFISPAAIKIYGYSLEDFLDNPMLWAEVIHPEDKYWVSEFIGNWEPGKIKYSEFRICRPDGEVRWVKTRCTGVFDDLGTLIQIEGIIRENTDAKRLEEKVWENEKRYRAVVEHSPQPIVVVQDEVIVYANWATAKLLAQKSKEDIMNRSIYELVHNDNLELVRERMTRPFNDQDIRSSELRFTLPNGQYIIAELVSVPMLYMGKPSYLIMGNDISERKRFEEKLTQSEARYRNLVEMLPEPIVVHQEGIILYANPTAVKVLEASSDDSLEGRSLKEFMLSDNQDLQFKTTMGEILNNEIPTHFQERLQTLKGHVLDVDVIATRTTIWANKRF